MGIANITQTHGWKNFMAKLYGIGASVVIIGALFKIMHWPFAGLMLIAGLGTEAVIFFFSAFEPIHEEIDWSLVYPELAGISDDDEIEIPNKKKQTPAVTGNSLVKFEEMLEKAGGQGLFEKLGTNLNKLNTTVSELSDVSNATVATNEFTDNMKNASGSVSKLSKTYNESADSFIKASSQLTDSYKTSTESLNYSVESLSDAYNKSSQKVEASGNEFITAYKKLTDNMNVDFTALKTGNKEYSDNVSTLNKNLAALNAIFEMQLNEADLDKMMEDLQGSVTHSKKYNTEVDKLGKRLEALNNVYGNMLTALNVKI
jgi:gliding motility-associated protein GldL